MRLVRDRSQPLYVKATFATFVIQFNGEAQIFRFCPPTYSANPPSGEIRGQEVRIRLVSMDHNPTAMRAIFDRIHESIRKNLKWGAAEIKSFNENLRQQAKGRLESRKTKFLADEGMVAALAWISTEEN